MSIDRRDYFAAAALQGLLAHSFRGGEANGYSWVGSPETARMAVEYADATLAELDKTSPTSEAAGDPPPAATPAAPTPEERLPELDLGDTAGPIPESAPPPTPRKLAPQCEAPGCPLEGKRRQVESTVAGLKRCVSMGVCDLHFDGLDPSILLEWHSDFRKTSAQKKCSEIVRLVDATTRAR